MVSMAVTEDFGGALGQLLDYWGKRFPGYQWTSYFPEENKGAGNFLERRGLPPQVREAVGVLLFNQYSRQQESKQVVKLGRENFELFRKVHQDHESGMYWTSQRIAAHLEDWVIYGYVEGESCLGVVYFNGIGGKDLEIFGLDLPVGENAPVIGKALLASALNQAKEEGARSMYFFHDPAFSKEVQELGFRILTIAVAYGGPVGNH